MELVKISYCAHLSLSRQFKPELMKTTFKRQVYQDQIVAPEMPNE